MLSGVRIALLRHLVRLGVLAMLVALPWLHQAGYDGIRGTLFAFDAFGIPFADPLGAIQILLTGKLPGWRLFIGAVLVLCATAILGRVFCSWVCPYGACADAVHGLRTCLSPRKTATKHRLLQHQGGLRRPSRSLSGGFEHRALFVLIGLVLVTLTGVPIVNILSFPGWLSILASQVGSFFDVSGVEPFTHRDIWAFFCIALVLMVEAVYGERVWCRFICPQSVVLSLATLGFTVLRRSCGLFRFIPEVRLVRDASRCTCGWPDGSPGRPCREVCPFGLFPGKPLPRDISPSVPMSAVSDLECIQCGRCLSACTQRKSASGTALHIRSVPSTKPFKMP